MSKWIGYLPDFYAASPQIAALQGALEQQTEALWTAENGLIDQLDVNKATWLYRRVEAEKASSMR